MELNTAPETPSKVRLALWLLYLSLGIAVIRVAVSWWLRGTPGPVEYWLINVLLVISIFHLQAHTWINWVAHGGFLIVPIVPVAVLLYYMIGKGKNWARITLLVLVILEILDSLLGVLASQFLPQLGHARLSLWVFLTSPHMLGALLKIIAVSLLFERTSSGWFRSHGSKK